MARNAKGQFSKGEMPDTGQRISEGLARDYHARSVAAKKENKTIAETLRKYLETDGGGGYTKGELLVMKAVNNHREGKLTFKDLRDLARILGEDTLNIKTDGPVNIAVSSPQIADALNKVLSGGAQPRKPKE